MTTEITIEKPKGYKSHFVVYDPNPKLIINLDYTHFQASMDLDDNYEWDAEKIRVDGSNLILTMSDD